MVALTGKYIGPYQLLDQIGQGGMGHVFVARHKHMDQKVALKLLQPSTVSDPQLVARFIQEARALAQLDHPAIVKVLHCDQLDDGTVYLVMEHLDGVSLREHLQRQSPLSLAEVKHLGLQITGAMVDVHSHGIVHRDVKPENVFLINDDESPGGFPVKVLDFGIAKVPPALGSETLDTQIATRAPMLLGTAAYMAPEQCRNPAAVTDRTDVYALGVMLFEMYSGRLPFVAEEAIEVISMHVQTAAPALRDLVPHAPTALDVLIASMLAKEPTQRPSMRRVREILSQLGDDTPEERDECPFPGLQPLTEKHSELFFGRESETREILAILERARAGGPPWLLIEGPGGCGKTSLVQSGVVPALREQEPSLHPRWRIACVRPSDDPIRHVAGALAADVAAARQAEQALQANPDSLPSLIATHLPRGCILLLIIEQLEEMFTLPSKAKGSFYDLVTGALRPVESPVRVLATVRSDMVYRLEQTPELARLSRDATRMYLRPMDEAALVHVVRNMTLRANLKLGEGLPEQMVRDTAGSSSPLPMLGHALRGLWMSCGRASVTHESYKAFGGVSGGLAQQAELLLGSLGEAGRESAKGLILSLVEVGRGGADTRRPRTRNEVLRAAGGGTLAEKVLMRLSGAGGNDEDAPKNLRLVTHSGDSTSPPSRQRIELVHETLLRQVPTISSWIDEERRSLERYADAERAAEAWAEAGFVDDALPGRMLIEHYRGSAKEHSHRLLFERVASERTRRFLRLGQRRGRRRRLLQYAIAALLLAAALAVAVIAVQAQRERKRAEANLQQVLLSTEQIVSHVDWVLARFHHTLPIRREMLRHIDESLASLPAQESARLAVRKAMIQTKHRRGDLAWHHETLARAAGFHAEARALIDVAFRRWPQDSTLRTLLALNHSKLGKLALARGDLDAAQNDFAAALALLEPHLDAADEDSRRTLATSYSETAELALARGRPSEAVRYYDQSLALLASNQGAYDRSLFALTLAERATAARHTGDIAGATAQLQKALTGAQAVVNANPGNAFFQWILGRIHMEIAKLRVGQDDLDAAAHYQSAIALARALYDGEPTNKRYALLLCASLRDYEALMQRQENLTQNAGDASMVATRCEIAHAFVLMDSDDERFQRLACP